MAIPMTVNFCIYGSWPLSISDADSGVETGSVGESDGDEVKD
jgi:hypothetical protein